MVPIISTLENVSRHTINRADVNWLGSGFVSLPQSLQNANEEDKEMFFKETFQFLSGGTGR